MKRLIYLTDAEEEVLDGIVMGLSYKVIAQRLGLNVRTVEKRVQRISDKTGIRKQSALAVWGLNR